MKTTAKRTALWVGKTTAALCISAVCLSIVVIFCNYSGCHIFNKTGATDYTWGPNDLKTNMLEGFSWIFMDSNGFNNIDEFASSPSILLMGSSHMEAANVLQDETTSALLNKYIANQTTYNIGMSSHNIYTCIKNISNALNEFEPKKYVIIETDSVELVKSNLFSAVDGTFLTLQSYDSGLIYYIQKFIPAVKAVYKNLDDWRNAGSGASESVEVSTDYSSSEYKSALNKFILHASDACRSVGVKLIIFYHPMTELDGSGNLIDPTDAEALNSFEETCRKNNVTFVNMHDDFFDMYEREHRLPYGFINTSVGKGHLNKYGHRVIAERLSKVIMSMESSQEVE